MTETKTTSDKTAPATHPVDSIELGGIVTVRDKLIEQQSQGKQVYRLESGDPSFTLPAHISEAICRALRDGHTHYTAGAGIKPLRQALAAKLCEQNHLPLAGPQQVLVTNGAMHGLYILFRALCSPGDEVIVPDPTWTETADNLVLAGALPVRAATAVQHGYRLTAEVIASHLTPRTKALVINSPHNPTGTVATREELEGIVRLAERHGLWVISDEAYEHVLYDDHAHISPGSLGYRRVISVYSFSKSYAMSGLRLGYLTVDDATLLERMTKLLRCTINGVNSATQWGGLAAVTGPQDATAQMAAEYQQRRELLWQGLKDAKLLHPFKPQGAFYLWARIDESWPGYNGERSGWAMTRYLADTAGIGSAPGEVFGPAGRGHIRFSFSCATEQVAQAAERLGEILS